jgi:hypothetical protein
VRPQALPVELTVKRCKVEVARGPGKEAFEDDLASKTTEIYACCLCAISRASRA